MNLWALLGIVLVLYAVMCIYIAIRKPAKLWDMAKIRGFRRVLTDKGTVIFFIVWGLLFGALGVWLMIK